MLFSNFKTFLIIIFQEEILVDFDNEQHLRPYENELIFKEICIMNSKPSCNFVQDLLGDNIT